ncbi:MAG TPA: hypothetical protein DC023_05620 [Oceanospirillaceae bacterium]|nr:hypothetical protein [Oceanospirillaceae bacterium]
MTRQFIGLGLWKFLQSVISVLAGVQSQNKRQQDFAGDNLLRIISTCLGGAVVLILVVLVMVNMALPDPS